MIQRHLLRRLLARILDLMLVEIPGLLFFPSSYHHPESAWPLVLYFLYNLVVILAEGKTLGRWVLRLNVEGQKSKASRGQLLFREISLYLLFPLVLLGFLFPGAKGLHESLTQTKVMLDDEKLSPYSLPRTRFNRF